MEDDSNKFNNVEDAIEYVSEYLSNIGVNLDAVNFSRKPNNLPADVDAAWNVILEEQKFYNETYGVQREEGRN